MTPSTPHPLLKFIFLMLRAGYHSETPWIEWALSAHKPIHPLKDFSNMPIILQKGVRDDKKEYRGELKT